jgi:hypothetical protein
VDVHADQHETRVVRISFFSRIGIDDERSHFSSISRAQRRHAGALAKNLLCALGNNTVACLKVRAARCARSPYQSGVSRAQRSTRVGIRHRRDTNT